MKITASPSDLEQELGDLRARLGQLEDQAAIFRESEAQLRDLVEQAPIGISRVGPDGVILWANREELRFRGCSAWRYVGRQLHDFFLDPARVDRILARTAAGETVRDEELALADASGRRRWIVMSATPWFEHGEFRYTRCFSRDITERKQGEENAARLSTLMLQSEDAIIAKDLDGTILAWSRGAERMYGYPAREAVGQPISLIVPEGREEELPRIFEKLRRGETMAPFDTQRRTRDGRLIEVSLTIAPIRNDLGEVTGATSVARDLGERRRAEESEQKLRSFGQAIREVVWMKELRTGRMLYVSPAYERIWGRPVSGLYRDPLGWMEAVHPEDAERVSAGVERAGAAGRYDLEYRIVRPDGEIRWVRERGFPVESESGAEARFAGLAEDVSERRQILDRLRRSQEMLDLAQRVGRIGAFDWDLTARTVTWSVELGSLLGLSGDFAGDYRAWLRLVHPEDRRRVRKAFSEAAEEDPELNVRYRIVRQDGEERWMWARGRAFRGAGESQRIAGVAMDITEQVRFEQALRESEDLYRALADSMPQIVWTAGRGGEIDYYNRRWFEYTGLQNLEAGSEAVIHADDFGPCQRLWRKRVIDGKPYECELRIRRVSDQSWRWHLSRAIPLQDEHGRVVRWFGTTTDIDDRKRIEMQLESKNADLRQFAYAASHDLKEPLRGVSGFAQLLARKYTGQLDEIAEAYLGFITDGVKRMQSLIESLQQFLEAGEKAARLAKVDANEALAAALDQLRILIGESDAAITQDVLPVVCYDEPQLVELFQNLVGNALKYRGTEPCRVHVSARPTSEGWEFAVQDNGIGIAPQYQERIFGIFKRLHGREYPGTGMGLAICLRIVQRHGGRIGVQSEEGGGARFYFTVPG